MGKMVTGLEWARQLSRIDATTRPFLGTPLADARRRTKAGQATRGLRNGKPIVLLCIGDNTSNAVVSFG
jgi:hypothetical protein